MVEDYAAECRHLLGIIISLKVVVLVGDVQEESSDIVKRKRRELQKLEAEEERGGRVENSFVLSWLKTGPTCPTACLKLLLLLYVQLSVTHLACCLIYRVHMHVHANANTSGTTGQKRERAADSQRRRNIEMSFPFHFPNQRFGCIDQWKNRLQ